MATTGKVPWRGFHAAARKYVVWRGYSAGTIATQAAYVQAFLIAAVSPLYMDATWSPLYLRATLSPLYVEAD